MAPHKLRCQHPFRPRPQIPHLRAEHHALVPAQRILRQRTRDRLSRLADPTRETVQGAEDMVCDAYIRRQWPQGPCEQAHRTRRDLRILDPRTQRSLHHHRAARLRPHSLHSISSPKDTHRAPRTFRTRNHRRPKPPSPPSSASFAILLSARTYKHPNENRLRTHQRGRRDLAYE